EMDTYDATGEVIATHPVDLQRDEIEAALGKFVGAIQQVPPMHSALKRDGQKLYELARAGIEVKREARSMTIYALDLIDFQTPDVTIEVRCSAGTYIRSIAHDVGDALGTGAHLNALRRTAAGPFSLDQAIGLAEFEAAARDGHGVPLLRSIDEALSDWPRAVLTAEQQQRATTGGRIAALDLVGTRCRAYDEHGQLIALLTFDQKKQWWRAEKVLAMNN
ncbi:MAG TPA: tRNA pseudouridine(55) synthase TruB, partial [Anaerolineae bacterium]|nr:tRNA pseudouridine(55) synthase TruB [Anaerolineae bacterium]